MNKAILAVAVVAILGGVYYFSSGGDSSMSLDATSSSTKSSVKGAKLESLAKTHVSPYVNNGFKLTQSGEKFILKVENEQKARDFLFTKLSNILPKDYGIILDAVKDDLFSDDQNSLTGFEFEMAFLEKNSGYDMVVTLIKLPNAIQKDYKFLQDMSDKEALSYTLSLNKNGNVNGVTLKNIAETNDNFNLKVNDYKAKFSGDINDKFKYKSGFGNIDFSSHSNGLNVAIANMRSNADQTAYLEAKSDMSIDSINVNLVEDGKTDIFLLENINSESILENSDGFIDFETSITGKKGALKNKSVDVVVDDFKYAINGTHFNIKTLSSFAKIKPNNKDAGKKFKNIIEKILQEGFDIGISSSARKITISNPMKIEINNYSFSLNIEVKKNSLSLKSSSKEQYLPFITVNARIALNNDDLEKNIDMFPIVKEMISKVKNVEGNLAIFEITYIKGTVMINGKNPLGM